MTQKIFSWALLIFFLIPSTAFAVTIDRYDVAQKINWDATVGVQEKIQFPKTLTDHTAFTRTIPLSYSHAGVDYRITVSQIKVVDDKDQLLTFTSNERGGNEVITVSDVTEAQKNGASVVISYLVDHAIHLAGDHAEVYWPAIANDLATTTGPAVVEVHLSMPIDARDVHAQCFILKNGASRPCEHGLARSIGSNQVDALQLTNATLAEQEQFAVLISFPKTAVRNATTLEQWFTYLQTHRLIEAGVIAALILVVLIIWRMVTPKGGDTTTSP